jgi:hypothetical protein
LRNDIQQTDVQEAVSASRRIENKMNSLETLLSKKIEEAEPATDILGADHKLLQVAVDDFINYFKFNLEHTKRKPNTACLEDKMERLYREEPVEFESFLAVWTSIWLKKWKQRVKLLLGNQNQKISGCSSTTLANGQLLWTKLECKRELLDIIVSALEKNAEICGTEILAENILKMELGKATNFDVNDKQQLLSVLNNSLRRAREMTQGCGPLIYVKIDKQYYAQ